MEIVGNPEADFAERIEFLLQLYFIGFRSTEKNTNDAGNLQVVSPSDASSVPLVEQNEFSVVFDCIADCRCLPEVEFVKHFDEQVRVLNLDDAQEIVVSQLSERLQALLSLGEFVPDSAWDGNVGELRPEKVEAVDKREV